MITYARGGCPRPALVDHRPRFSRHAHQFHRSADGVHPRTRDHESAAAHQHSIRQHHRLVSGRVYRESGLVGEALRPRWREARLHGFCPRVVDRGVRACVCARTHRPARASRHPRPGRSGQLARRGKGHRRVVPCPRARLRDGHLQQRRRHRQHRRVSTRDVVAMAVWMEDDVCRHGQPGIWMAAAVALAVRRAGTAREALARRVEPDPRRPRHRRLHAFRGAGSSNIGRRGRSCSRDF